MRYKSNVRSIERQFDASEKEIEMSAITVSVPHSHRSIDQLRPPQTSARQYPVITTAAATAGEKSSSDRASSEWRLTDRGTAVVMVIAAMILTAAIAVIGLTAVRVTSPGGDAGLRESRQAQH
jgi:hypothetical protein